MKTNLTPGRCRGGAGVRIGLLDLHEIENATVDSDHGGQQGHDLQLVEHEGLEGALGHGQNREENEQNEDDEGL